MVTQTGCTTPKWSHFFSPLPTYQRLTMQSNILFVYIYFLQKSQNIQEKITNYDNINHVFASFLIKKHMKHHPEKTNQTLNLQ
jgi:hypothetical protein